MKLYVRAIYDNVSRICEVASAPCGLDKSWEKYNILFSAFIKEAIWVKRSVTAYSLLCLVPIFFGVVKIPKVPRTVLLDSITINYLYYYFSASWHNKDTMFLVEYYRVALPIHVHWNNAT